MPILNNKYDHVKVYRPSGTKYAVGVSKDVDDLYVAIGFAKESFLAEFGRYPQMNKTVIEIIITDKSIMALIYEIPWDE